MIGDDVNLEVVAFLICDSVVRDATSGKTSVQGIFDTVNAANTPAVQAGMTVYFRLKFEQHVANATASLAIQPPSGIRHITPDLPLVNVGPTGATEGWINIQGMVFPEYGMYGIDLLINGETKAHNFLIVQKPGAAPYGSQLN
jgi:hypothetical protein